MSESSSALACLECGKPIVDGQRWVHFPQCAAVMKLVRYGRSNVGEGTVYDPDGLTVEPDRFNRYRRQARIVGRFPSRAVRKEAHRRDGERCQFLDCTERGPMWIDWRADDPDQQRPVRADDLRTLCVDHHRAESLRRFGEGGHVARTRAAIWARIVSGDPLVLRDDESLWANRQNLRLLSNWPLASEQTGRDLKDWAEGFLQVSSEARLAVRGAEAELDDPTAGLDAAMDRLALPPRRRGHLVQAIRAMLLKSQADEATFEEMKRAVGRSRRGEAPDTHESP